MMVNVEHVSKTYGKVVALDDLSFSVEKGELYGIIGPDGAGKTTLIRLLATLLYPNEGKLAIDGLDTINDYRQLRMNIGYMPGRFSLYQDLSVRENLEFFAKVFEADLQDNMPLIEPVYKMLRPFESRKAGALSGGMKQKLALSCALIHRPEILLLDEPTFGVDPVSRAEFWDMLAEIKSEGITTLVSTAYMDEAARCDRIILLSEGKKLAENTPKGIISAYKSTLFAAFTQNTYQTLLALRTWEKIGLCYVFGESLHFSPKKEDLGIVEIEAFLEEQHIEFQEVIIVEPTVEDCFIALMQQ